MEYVDLVSDFFARTKENLNLVRKAFATSELPAYEATQLINSFIGAVVMAEQAARDGKNLINDDQLLSRTQTILDAAPGRVDLKTHFRNAFAHGRFEPKSDDSRSITHIELQDAPTGRPVNWIARISIRDMEQILDEIFVAAGCAISR